MPNVVNEIMLSDLKQEVQNMGSCVVVEFGALQPQQDIEIRGKMREIGVRYRVVRSRLAKRAFASIGLEMDEALNGRCGIAVAEREGAIKAAKILRDWIKKTKNAPLTIRGGVVEGTTFTGEAAAAFAELPDRETVHTMLVTAISGPARSIATLFSAVGGGLARCMQAKVDQESDA